MATMTRRTRSARRPELTRGGTQDYSRRSRNGAGVSESEIICERRGTAGFVVLDRPNALNALTHGMVRALSRALDAWEHDGAVSRVVLTAAGSRAFCAGGDVRQLHDAGRRGDHATQLAFWRDEYTLNRRIKLYRKPIVALVDGIVMGGGVGLAIHAAHRIAGERFLFAMPEVGIGFFPDVGATYFLPRLPGKIGTYLALTGARVKAADALACGLATAHVPSSRMAALAEALCGPPALEDLLAPFLSEPPPGTLLAQRTWIDRCFAPTSVAAILAGLDVAAGEGIAAAAEAARAMRANAPLSLAIALRQMQIGPGLASEAAMRTEFRIVSRVCRGHDFYEGVRAAIVDRDNRPHWQPADTAAVDPRMVEAHFAPLPGGEELWPEPSPATRAEASA
jgi:enoyl-CoA hydratase